MNSPGKRTARVKLTITRRSIDSFEPADKPWIAWDDKLTGYGVLIHPSGVKSYIVNYRLGDGGRAAPNKRLVIGRCGRMAPELARKEAHRLLGMVAMGEDPAAARTRSRRMPSLGQAFEQYMKANPKRKAITNQCYRDRFERPLGDWLSRPLDSITREDVEERFNRVTEKTAGRRPTSACRCCARSTAGPAWILGDWPIRLISGSRAAAGFTTSRGARFRRLPRSCRVGGRASRPW